jgi:hypothetical protein
MRGLGVVECNSGPNHPHGRGRTTPGAANRHSRSLSSVPTDRAVQHDHKPRCAPTTYAAAPKIAPTTPSSTSTTRSTSAIVVAGPIKAML